MEGYCYHILAFVANGGRGYLSNGMGYCSRLHCICDVVQRGLLVICFSVSGISWVNCIFMPKRHEQTGENRGIILCRKVATLSVTKFVCISYAMRAGSQQL